MKSFEGTPQRVTDEEEIVQEPVAEETEGVEAVAEEPRLERVTDDEPEAEAAEAPAADEGPSREEQLASLRAELTGEQAPEDAEMDEETIRKEIAHNEAAMVSLRMRLNPIDRLVGWEAKQLREAATLKLYAAVREAIQTYGYANPKRASNLWMNFTALPDLMELRNEGVDMRQVDKLLEDFPWPLSREYQLNLPTGWEGMDATRLREAAKRSAGEAEKIGTELAEERAQWGEGIEEETRATLAEMARTTEELKQKLPQEAAAA